MAITVAAITDALAKNLGGQPRVIDAVSILNAAGTSLVASHPWNWLIRPPVDLGTTASQAYAALPSDFGEIQSLRGTAGTPIGLLSRDEWTAYERQTPPVSSGFVACVFEYSSGDGPPAKRLYLSPTPTETDADAFRLVYRAGWTQRLTDAQQLVLPVFMEPLYWEFLWATARGWDEQDAGGMTDRLNAVVNGSVFALAVATDTRSQPVVGPILNGGAVPYMRGAPGNMYSRGLLPSE